MIRVLILSAALIVAALLPARAQEVLEPNPQIEAVIGSQFNAFEAQNVTDAWQYASPNIQAQFGNPQNFGRMVEQAFPMVWEPSDFEFIDLQSFGALTVQRVEVLDRSGNLHYLGYAMIETEAGWRINGVQVLRAPDLGV